jgi:hypothetical protein
VTNESSLVNGTARRLAVALAVGVASGAALWLVITAVQDDAVGHGIPDLRTETKDLLTGGRRVSLETAEDASPFSLVRPHSSLASDESLTEVWIGGADDPTVGFRYQSGVEVILTPWPDGKDPEDSYRAQASDFAGAVEMIAGNPAWVIPKDVQAPGYPPETMVSISVDNVEAVISGGSWSREQVVEIAASVEARAVD